MARKGQTMTRYSHNPLAKKFKCPRCDNWFRSLQGLSGHIRFRHGVYEQQQNIGDRVKEVEILKGTLVEFCRGEGLLQEVIDARVIMLGKWQSLLIYCRSFGVNPGFDDFKKYIVESFKNV
jgi:uncharacterized C2H2 Zn-finger protein